MAEGHKCFSDGCETITPFGLRMAGLLSELPPNRRGYLWHCPKHEAEALARRDAAMQSAFMK